MDCQDLRLTIEYVGSSGIILSSEQKAALETSLTILKNNHKFDKTYFWGKILGVKDDYFIAQGVGKNEFEDRKILYSKNLVNWGLLPPATPEMKEKAKLAKGRFTGDPSFEFEHTEIKKIGEGEEQTEEEETVTIKEEERLAAVIAEIDYDVRIIPRGAFVKTAKGSPSVHQPQIFMFPGYVVSGLSISEAAKLCSYMHFREATKMHEQTLLEKADMNPSIDFMDPLDKDIPKGSWSLQFERGSAQVTLRSLSWQGYVFFHVPGTRRYGSIYVGSGEKNMDLPFML
ncbi:hypothetical protein CAPTEDRAFT_118743 [Capitella teleta]|uniref:Radial spoke head protein 9 homolog n=1 Tax=Capitella teleta TaxID=283909 RepID=R7T626_CAPTE|nr:hypothetical protein CAPTEDRAFT_118743 [Capitella teleta]|eukprot:ELT88698.1 hypothetical protein CAPTEDRAFT_118743 [Capitella teleta]